MLNLLQIKPTTNTKLTLKVLSQRLADRQFLRIRKVRRVRNVSLRQTCEFLSYFTNNKVKRSEPKESGSH